MIQLTLKPLEALTSALLDFVLKLLFNDMWYISTEILILWTPTHGFTCDLWYWIVVRITQNNFILAFADHASLQELLS